VEHALRGVRDRPEAMYGRRKMTRFLRRQGAAKGTGWRFAPPTG
jgi:hypothetical protein